MKKIKLSAKNNLKLILLLMLLLSTVGFSTVDGTIAFAAGSTEQSALKTDSLPTNSKIFAPPTNSSTLVKKIDKPAKKEALKSPENKFSRFLIAMLGVLLSALAIFGTLNLYKVFVAKKTSFSKGKKIKNSFDSPKNFKESINSFLDKTEK